MENKFVDFEVIAIGKLDDYNYPGVWAMFGHDKKCSNDTLICLNVGKTKCIKEQLKVDLARLNGIEKKKWKEYRNQFGEKIFDYPEYAKRIDFVYDNIKQNYENFYG